MNGINVSSVDFGIMSKERKLQLSNGEVLIEGAPTKHMEDKIKLDFPEDGLFSEKIFGRSRDSRHEVMDGKFSDSLPKRSRTFGHMVLSVPYVVPYLYVNNGSKINLILGVNGSKMMKEIIEWRAALVRVKKGTPLYNHFTFNRPKGTITTEIQKIEINSAYMLNNTIEVPNPNKPGETMLDGAYEYFSVPLQVLKDEASGKISTESKEYSSLSAIASKETGAYVFLGAYAVLHLLSQINLNDEIIYSRLKMPSLRKKIEEAGSESEKRRVLENYKKTSERYQILLNFKKRDFNLEDIASDIFLIQPAGLRDVSLRVDSNGITTPIVPKVNETYKTLIKVSNKLKKFGKSITPEEIMKYGPEELDWSRDIPTQDIFIRDAKQIQECINEIIIKSIAGKIGKKKGRFRQSVLSKRLDYSGIGVITPDPELELDQIGISIHILKKWMEGILGDSSSDKVPKAEILAFLKNYNTLVEDSVHITKGGETQHSYKDGNIDVQFVEMGERDSNKLLITKQFNSILSEFRLLATRFPSLHKFNTLGYEIVVTYDNTTRLHPLVCKHYNADFDGDQMALKLIQTPDAVREVDKIMLPSRNLLNTSGDPLISPTQDAVLGSYYMTLDKSNPDDKVMTFHDYDDMYKAYQLGRVHLNKKVIVGTTSYDKSTYKDQFRRYLETKECKKNIELHSGLPYSELESEGYEPFLIEEVGTFKTIKPEQNDIQYIESTVGRFIFNSCIPQDLGFVDRGKDPYGLELDGVLEKFNSIGLTSKNLDEIISRIIKDKPIPEVKYIVDMIKHKGYKYATLSGMSMSLQDIYTHPDKKGMVMRSMKVVEQVDKEEREGKISKKQAYDKRIAEWTKTNDDLANKTMAFLPDDNPVKMMSVSGSRGSKTQITQLMGMRGLMSDTSSNIIETPVTASFIEGMTMTEYFTASYGTRKGIFDRSNRTKETGESTRTSVYGAEKMVVSDGDCGDTEGILMGPLIDDDGNEMKGTMERIKGKFLLQDLVDANGKVVVRKGMPVLEIYKELEDIYKDNPIKVRSPISCKHRLGTCAKCFGYNYGSNRFSKIGDAIGVLAAQTIGEPGTQLTMRTFHTGGVAKGDITQGFTAVRNLLEKVNKYPPKLQSAIQSAVRVDDEKFNKIQQEVMIKLNDLLNESGEEVIVKHDITFKDYGVLNAKDYIIMMKTLKDYLQISYHSQGVDILDAHYEVIARVMGNNLKVEDAGDSIFIMGQTIEWSDLEATNLTMVQKGLRPVLATPSLTSLKQLAMGPRNPFTAMTFQNINKVLTTALSSQGRDDLTNPMSSIAVSNILASGEGNRRYMHKKKSRYENIISNRELMDELGVPMYEEEASSELEKAEQLDMTWETKEEEVLPLTTTQPDYEEGRSDEAINLDWDLDLLDKLSSEITEDYEEDEVEEDEDYGEVEENPTNLSWD